MSEVTMSTTDYAERGALAVLDIHVDGQLYRCVALPSRTSGRSRALTKSEIDVARLAVCGYSAQAIAGLRGTSRRTVNHQLGSVFRKLGISSRNELCAALMG